MNSNPRHFRQRGELWPRLPLGSCPVGQRVQPEQQGHAGSSGRTAWAPATCGGPPSPPESAGLVTACSSDCVSISGREELRLRTGGVFHRRGRFSRHKIDIGTSRSVSAFGHTPSASWPRPFLPGLWLPWLRLCLLLFPL